MEIFVIHNKLTGFIDGGSGKKVVDGQIVEKTAEELAPTYADLRKAEYPKTDELIIAL